MSQARVACIIPTRNAGNRFRDLMVSLQSQDTVCDVVVVDSTSRDGTPELARSMGAKVETVSPAQFSHGGTRQAMVDRFRYDFYVLVTQDALPCDNQAVTRLLAPFANQRVGAVCGRQVARSGASPYSEHARLYSYPPESRVVELKEVLGLGLNAAIMSNSFAAYRATALSDVGGFPKHVIVAEDRFVAAKMLLSGWCIAYAGDALCWHSHDYSLSEEFRRYFDMGVFIAREAWIRKRLGAVGGEGMRYVMSELRFLGAGRIHLWPTSLVRNATKLLGYGLGKNEALLPLQVKRRLSMHRQYWEASK